MAILASKVFCSVKKWIISSVWEKKALRSPRTCSARQQPIFLTEGGRGARTPWPVGACLPKDTGIVLIHDGARPFITEAVIRRVLDGVTATGGAVPCVPPSQRSAPDLHAGPVLPYEVQTPQGFRRTCSSRLLPAPGSQV